MLSLTVEWLSMRGGREYNEDACGHWRSAHHFCAVLADGAGHHGGGDVASKMAVRELVGRFAQQPSEGADNLRALVRAVNDVIIAGKTPGTVKHDMHSTVVCLALDLVEKRVHWAHAGDSRLYWFRDGLILRRTRDHSYVQSLVDAGLLDSKQLRSHPKRSELRSALGVSTDVLEVDSVDASQGVEDGDVFLLCTDGVWEFIADERLSQLLTSASGPRAWLDALADEVVLVASGKADHDNFTALAIWVDGSTDTNSTR
jgi:serine/threonine protein phosphatase PrpC